MRNQKGITLVALILIIIILLVLAGISVSLVFSNEQKQTTNPPATQNVTTIDETTGEEDVVGSEINIDEPENIVAEDENVINTSENEVNENLVENNVESNEVEE